VSTGRSDAILGTVPPRCHIRGSCWPKREGQATSGQPSYPKERQRSNFRRVLRRGARSTGLCACTEKLVSPPFSGEFNLCDLILKAHMSWIFLSIHSARLAPIQQLSNIYYQYLATSFVVLWNLFSFAGEVLRCSCGIPLLLTVLSWLDGGELQSSQQCTG
jgi:hypothetical protein